MATGSQQVKPITTKYPVRNVLFPMNGMGTTLRVSFQLIGQEFIEVSGHIHEVHAIFEPLGISVNPLLKNEYITFCLHITDEKYVTSMQLMDCLNGAKWNLVDNTIAAPSPSEPMNVYQTWIKK